MKRILSVIALAAATVAVGGGAAAATTTAAKAYPGTNGLIAFVRANQVYTISPSGSGLKQLTTSGKNYNPVWNPAGTKIAYEHEAPAGVRNIWVMNADGSHKRQWTSTGTTWGSPAWSPTGKKLLFTNGGSDGTLETTSATTPLQPATAMSGYNADQGLHAVLFGNNPAWTTGQIAFSSNDLIPGNPNANMCLPPDGSSYFGPCIEIYNTATHHFSNPSNSVVPMHADCGIDNDIQTVDWPRWSPDGSNLLVSYHMSPTDACNGGQWHEGTYKNPQPAFLSGDEQADYSPDGNFIVLTNALPAQQPNIIIESSTGANRTTLTQGSQPNWQPLS